MKCLYTYANNIVIIIVIYDGCVIYFLWLSTYHGSLADVMLTNAKRILDAQDLLEAVPFWITYCFRVIYDSLFVTPHDILSYRDD